MLGLRTLNPSRLAVITMVLLLLPILPIDDVDASTTKVPGMDVGPVAAAISYTSATDHDNYAALSSQDPSSIGMNRNANLWIIDGMYMVSQDIDVTVENFGDTTATSFNVKIEIMHNEYSNFILYSQTQNVATLAAGAQTTVSATWIPDYSGNHTLKITTLLANDADTTNDVGTRSLTIGNLYDRAESSGSWTLGQNWYVSNDASLSGTNSFHVGGSTSSTNYGINWDTSLVSAVIDTSDAHPSPNHGYGIGFFYTGDAVDSDGYDIDVWNGNSWQRITSTTITGYVDDEFITGSNWLINLNTVNGFGVPWWNIPASSMNSQFKFRINFHTNAAGNSIGYWFEDIVMFYDQKARADEFSIGGNVGQAGHARAGEWAETVLTATNQGNLTDEIQLSVENIPTGWDYKFQHMTGSMIPNGESLQLSPGESRNFKLLVQPAEGSTLGSTQVAVKIQSSEPTVSKSLTASFVVDPDFQPSWLEQDPAFYCLPGNLCQFQVTLNNDGDEEDTFTLSSSEILTHDGWTFGMHYDQTPIVTIASGSSETIDLTANLPSSALPGMRATTMFTATSQTDSSKSSIVRANVTASMVSSGHVGVNSDDIPVNGWWISPGETITIPFTIWNNATQQDTYAFSFDTSGVFGWTVGMPSTENVVIAPSGTAVVMLSFTAPTTVLANDPGPIITPHAISTASGMSTTEAEFSSIRVRQHHDLNVSMNQLPDNLIQPGTPVELPFMIENLGNGDDDAVVNMDFPSSWQCWFEVGGTAVDLDQLAPIPLSTVHDGQHYAELSVWILVPTNEQPGDFFDLEISVTSSHESASLDSGSSISWQYQTMMTAMPYLEPFSENDVSAWLEQSLEFTLLAANTGNTYDSSMRVRISASSSQHISVTLDTSRTGVEGSLNVWMNLPMSAGANETLTITFASANSFQLGQTIQLTVDIEGGLIGANSVPITSSTSINITVDQKRQLDFSWGMETAEDEIVPNEPTEFNIVVSSQSTMSVRVNLDSQIPAESLLDCTPSTSNGTVELLLPAADSGPQSGTIECQITLIESDLKQTLNLQLYDDRGELVWSDMVHLKTEETSKDSGAFGSFNVQLLGIVSGVLFVVFVVVMAAMIMRRMSRLDSMEYEDAEESEVGGAVDTTIEQIPQTASADISQPLTGAPGPMPGAPGPMPVAEVVTTQIVQSAQPEPQVQQQAGPESYSDEELRAAGWSDVQILQLRGETNDTLTDAFGSLESSGNNDQNTIEVADSGQALPTFNCIVTGNVLTTTDSWWQCKNCGGFAEIGAIGAHTHCPSCNTPL